MKAEIYSVTDKSFNPKSLDKKMNSVTNRLREADIEILYKTDLESDKIKLLEALRQSYATDEGIQLIIIANALDATADCDTIQLFKKLCPKHTENSDFDEDSDDENISQYKSKGDLENLATEYELDAKDIKKAASKKKKASKPEPSPSSKVVNEIWSTGDLGKGYEGCFMLYDNKLVLALPKESLTKVSTAEMIISGAKKATSAKGITTGNLISGKVTDHFDYYSIAQEDYKSKKKNGFAANFFPQKGDKPLEVVRKVVLMIASVTFIITAVILCKLLFVEPAQVEKNYEELREIVHNVRVNSDTEKADTDAEEEEELDRFARLKAINPEIVGWLYIPNTTYIDYPVLEHIGDGPYSQYYLHRDYKGNGSSYGSVFVDYRCEHSVQSKNVILHGHNMDNGMVFHQLLSYANLGFYQSAPVIQFDTPDYDADWKIISIFKTNTLGIHGDFFDYLRGEFDNETDFMDFVYNIMERSLIDTGVTVNEDDQLLTLSTCSYELTNFRTVVVARRVRKGEDSKVDVSKAAINPDAVWPQGYYAKNGGQRKELTDFKTACLGGETPWYDGDYKIDKHDIRKKDSDEEEKKRKEEEERLESERLESERLESERLEEERLESERLESERLESEKAESEKVEKEKKEKEKAESEKAESERLESERLESERIESERIESERIESERIESERIESERIESERIESERIESERIESERLESERNASENQEESQPDDPNVDGG